MNKVDPDVVVDDFITTIRSSHRDWQTIDIALTAQPVAIKRKAATDSFLQLAVTWESFMSDWWVAAINRDSTTFVATLEARLRGYAKRDMRLDPTADLAATLITKAHLDLEAVRRLLDPDGNNVVFRSLPELKKDAIAALGPRHLAKVRGLSNGQWQVADLTRIIRNALAHQSRRALDELNDRLAAHTTKPAFRWTGRRRLSISGTRRYLRTPDGKPRIIQFHDEIEALARALKL